MKLAKKKKNTRFLIILESFLKLFSISEPVIKKRIVYGVFFVFITILLNTLSPFLLKKIIENFSLSPRERGSILLLLGISYAVAWGTSQITMQLREISCFRVIERIARALTLKIFDHINSLPVQFVSQIQLGGLLDTINRAQEGFSYLFSGLFFYMIPTILEIVIACCVLIFFLPLKFTFIFLIMILLYACFSFWGLKKVTKFQEENIRKSHEAQSYLFDCLLNYENIKIFCSQKAESHRVDLHLKESELAQIKASVFTESLRLGQGAILGITLLFLTIMSVSGLIDGSVQIEGFILINAYFMQLTTPLNYFSLILKDIKEGLANIETAFKIFEEKAESYERDEQIAVPKFKNMALCSVSFGYQPNQTILKNISFSLEPGKMVAFVGETGSGKSTIAKILLRFYDAYDGEIFLGNINYRDYPPEVIRNQIGYVPQTPVFFCNTVRYNLTYAYPEASPQEIWEALEKAHLKSFIRSLPNGLDTIMGEKGVSFSGGEKQRLALARVFLTKRKLYIFDEATSALDSQTQNVVQNHIFSLKKAAPVIIISHRLTTVRKSDEILVLSKGEIIEKGTHKTLLDINKKYASLWRASSFNPDQHG